MNQTGPFVRDEATATVRNLRVEISSGAAIVEGVDFSLRAGEILGLVGESGSGKTTTALAMLGFTTSGAVVADGTLTVGDVTIRLDGPMSGLRGALIAYVPQNPGRALNPSMRIGGFIRDLLRYHKMPGDHEAMVLEALDSVGLPGTRQFARRYPHQISGGQQQRVCIAAALACNPALIVLDEPTTGLDVLTQAKILQELDALRDRVSTSMVYVSHDLAVVSQIADRVAVMYAGQLVEHGPTEDVLSQPSHPYTRGLLASIPDHRSPSHLEPMAGIAAGVDDRPLGCAFAPRCMQVQDDCVTQRPPLAETEQDHSVRCWHWQHTPPLTLLPASNKSAFDTLGRPVLEVVGLAARHGSGPSAVTAALDVSFTLRPGQCVALVGASGSGKTTVARAIAGLHPIAAGSVTIGDEVVTGMARSRTLEQRRRLQIIFQNPSDALNPRHTVLDAIARPARMLRHLSRREAEREVVELLDLVRLPSRTQHRVPSQLSGGERQRVAIARALAARPDIILCDEITSALDVSVQAAVIEVLEDLRSEFALALLFITHDLGVVASAADDVLVLEAGLVSEQGRALEVLQRPQGSYSQQLVAAAPSISLLRQR